GSGPEFVGHCCNAGEMKDQNDRATAPASHSASEPSSEDSSGSSQPCNSTWIWSCGWELVDSDCEDPGEPPSSSGAYDGQVAGMTA
ncbi:hypothetical protein, partial [Novipirellula sp.]|uniref:hypothetical protein n=1 Tax=Novipirellula sp. TaxID=2795430 RepID=UPI0035625E70